LVRCRPCGSPPEGTAPVRAIFRISQCVARPVGEASGAEEATTITVIEANIDDLSPQILGYAWRGCSIPERWT